MTKEMYDYILSWQVDNFSSNGIQSILYLRTAYS